MPMVQEEVFRLRDLGELEILQKGEVLGRGVGVDEVRGPIRIRRGGEKRDRRGRIER